MVPCTLYCPFDHTFCSASKAYTPTIQLLYHLLQEACSDCPSPPHPSWVRYLASLLPEGSLHSSVEVSRELLNNVLFICLPPHYMFEFFPRQCIYALFFLLVSPETGTAPCLSRVSVCWRERIKAKEERSKKKEGQGQHWPDSWMR